MEPEDRDAVAGALRETAEEIGLDASHVEILGRLDSYMTVTGYEVTPVVGAVTPPFELKADPKEVADIFEVPLAFFLDPANHQRHSRTINPGVVRAYYAITNYQVRRRIYDLARSLAAVDGEAKLPELADEVASA